MIASPGVTRLLLSLGLTLMLAGCGPAAPPPGGPSGASPEAPGQTGPKTLQAIMKVEPASLAARPLTSTGISIALPQRIFNATLDLEDGQLNTHPYLAEALPQLNSESWKVLPDGKMETTWHLRPGLVWHDVLRLRPTTSFSPGRSMRCRGWVNRT